MKPAIDHTHDPAVTSWVDSANRPGADFPIQNLPFGVCRPAGSSEQPRVCVAIGDFALAIADCSQDALFSEGAAEAAKTCESDSLNAFMAAGRPHWVALRHELHRLFRAGVAPKIRSSIEKHLLPLDGVELLGPAKIGDYSDFYTSIYHAENVSRLFGRENSLPPNYKYIPIGYHGRASSIVVSGTPVIRPRGQIRENPSDPVQFRPTRSLDYELEIGVYVGPGNHLGEPVGIENADSHIFGLCLLNDWSARDIQTWEYQPLGPFLSKSFMTSISPWVITLEALAPFRTRPFERRESDPAPLPYLASDEDQLRGGIDLTVAAFIRTAQMRQHGQEAFRLSRGSTRPMYWTIAQLIAHHTSNGCNLRPGDLLATGTVSGNTDDSRGCLLELTERGTRTINLPTGETRGFLADGDEVIFRAGCQAPDRIPIGFGECRGIVHPPRPA